jgi:CheY-like chemotaxis protein/two-component sensor histidine kinase
MEAEAGRIKDEFLANVSHELRGPLSSIGTWAHVLSSPQTDPATQRQAIAAIERSVKAGARLIDDLLDLSRVLAGKLNLSLRLVDLAPIVEAAVETAHPAAAAKEIDLQVARDPGPFFVLGDADRLQQIAWNLLSNAVKFTPRRGQVRVAIARDGSLWKLQVSDTGQGLDPEFVPHVFERFRQAENSPSRRHSGLGLGLAIVRQLAELHGGQVAAASEGLGKGAVFTVHLPVPALLVTPSAQAPPETTLLTAFESELSPDALKGRRVLLVDDDPDAREALMAVLGYYGAEVRSASNVLEALEAFVLRPPDVLVSDLAMPEQDGFDLIRLIRALPATDGGRVPAIALSAFASHRDRERALAAGFDAHVPKPAEPAQLVGTLLALSGPLSP